MRFVTAALCIMLVLAAAGCGTDGSAGSAAGSAIRVEPSPEGNLYAFARVVLVDVTLSPGTCVQRGAGGTSSIPCVVVQGQVRNMDLDHDRVALFAYGYDIAGQRVAETLDADGEIAGQIVLQLEHGDTGDFALHLSECDETEVIRIFAFTYAGSES
ncbi:MAG: hypothetical protein GX600_01935 [Dehalococcoidia bacterium]|jgi:hypothetical protein|nr:hypothetical protein [Dehalococcoidia bacterium]